VKNAVAHFTQFPLIIVFHPSTHTSCCMISQEVLFLFWLRKPMERDTQPYQFPCQAIHTLTVWVQACLINNKKKTKEGNPSSRGMTLTSRSSDFSPCLRAFLFDATLSGIGWRVTRYEGVRPATRPQYLAISRVAWRWRAMEGCR